jgi:hypothetical protein
MVMRKAITHLMICGILTALLAVSCGEDSPVTSDNGNPPPEPTVLPVVPVPKSPDDVLPAKSEALDVGLSSPLRSFVPMVGNMCQKKDDASMAWTAENRRLKLVCNDGVLALAMCDNTATARTYLTESPRLLHRRYWKQLVWVILDPGTEFSRAVTITSGSSTTNTVSQSFSQTIGVEVSASAGWGPFSAEVKASYSQTSTEEEVHSVTFSEEHSVTDTYSVAIDPAKTMVYALWQLVDVFVIVDDSKNPIHISDTLNYVEIPEVTAVEFPSSNVIYQSVTRFDPVP